MEVPYVKIGVSTPEGGEAISGIYKLPVSIGRGKTCTIPLKNALGEISREHVRIQTDSNGELVLQELSLNGTYYHGKKINQETINLLAEDEFEIMDFRVTLSKHLDTDNDPVIFKINTTMQNGTPFIEANGSPLPTICIGPNFLIAVLARDGVISMESVPSCVEQNKLLDQFRLNELEPLFVIIPVSEKGIFFLTESGNRGNVFVGNIAARPNQQISLKPGDVVTYHDIRLHIFEA